MAVPVENKPSPHPFTEQDIHLMLASLRLMQANLPQLPEKIQEIATNQGEFPLPGKERFDTLCEVINFDLPKNFDL